MFLTGVLKLVAWDFLSTEYWGEVVGMFVGIHFDEKYIEW